MVTLFISYRRVETEAQAGRLYESLTHRLSDVRIFMDVDSLQAGEDFVERLDHALSSSQVELVMIGPQWLTVMDESGRPRLNDESDFVRQEVAKAFERTLAVIPVLVQGAALPREDQLPENLKELARRQPIELRHASWSSGVGLLAQRIEDLTGWQGRRRWWRGAGPKRGRRSRGADLLMGGILAFGLILSVVGVYWGWKYITEAPRRRIAGLVDQVRPENPTNQVKGALKSLRDALMQQNDPRLTREAVTGLKKVVLAGTDRSSEARQVRNLALETIKQVRLNDLTEDFRGDGLKGGDLVGVDLSRTNLKGVSLEAATVERSNFSGADLTNANFSGAYVRNTNFSAATLDGTDLEATDWFNAAGLTMEMLRSARKGAMPCPSEKESGQHDQAVFEAELKTEYGTTLRRLGPDGVQLQRLWDEYRKPGGVCELVDQTKGEP